MIGWVLAAQIAIVARGPDTASACQPIELSVAARAPGAVAPYIALPVGGALQLLRSSVVAHTGQDASGALSTIAEGTFVVATSAIGRVTLPAFVATSGSLHARATPVTVSVRESDAVAPQVLVRASLDAGPGHSAEQVYVGQQVDYVVDVQLNEPARQRLRRNPTFFPPEMPAVLAYDLPAPAPLAREGRHCFETLSYHRALFPLFPGTSSIPPAVLTYSLPLSTSFFSREESYELRTDSVSFAAVEPPAEGRPPDFIGAVGKVRASAQLSSLTARMGDPVVLTLRLDGTGNVKLLPRPAISLGWAAIALGEERVTVDTTAAVVSGSKEFDWLLTPRRAGRQMVPAVRYPYFDPDAAGYALALTDSIGLDVASASLASADTAAVARLSIRTVLRAERPPVLPARGWYWALLLAAPVPAALRRARARRRRHASGLSPARRLRALAAARSAPEPRALRRAYLDALRERVPAAAEGSSRTTLGRILRRAGVTEATAQSAEDLLERLDAAAFSPSGTVERALAERAVAVTVAVDAEAVRVRPTPVAGSALLIVALCAGAIALSAMPQGVERTFADGVRAYTRGEFSAAQRLFARTTARVPRAVDAWANFGTAAWATNDTARAVLGWQRALRLDPLDAESRDRLAALQPPLIGAPAYVPPIPVDAAALTTLIVWVAAWLVLALPAARRPPHGRALAGAALAVALVTLAATLELNDRVSVQRLGVLRGTRTLLASPTPDAASSAAASAGEVGTLGPREGAWVRITLDGARAGWLPVAAVLSLDDGAASD